VVERVDHVLGAPDGGACRITRVGGLTAKRAPVVLMHGMFTDRRFWLSDRDIGLAAYLAERGHQVYILQRRGLSDGPDCGRARLGLVEHMTYDVPAMDDWVAARHDQPAFWIGHSFGGVTAARALARHVAPDRLGGLVLLASQYQHAKRMLDWPGHILTRGLVRLRGHLPARSVGLGPVDEPAAAARDACDWVAQGRRSGLIRDDLARLACPLLAVSGSADRVDPTAGCRAFASATASRDSTFIEAGVAHGYARDYDHPGIVISKDAQREIWPLIGDWLAARSQGVSSS
tara:strand:+ start:3762 stop:4628 length:867 start_codon:yes stop_codon:yes gene_type:complete